MISRLLGKIKSTFERKGFLAVIIAGFCYPFRRRRHLMYQDMLRLDSNKERFSAIYEKSLWPSDESRSGEGSELAYTQNLRRWLPTIIAKYDIRTVVDAPCGDFAWMKLVLPNVKVKYHGFDIVDIIVKTNRTKYSSEDIRFDVADICADRLPSGDLLIVRDCLFHLSYQDIGTFLKNIEPLEYKYLLTTTHLVDDGFANSDISTGDARRIDLFAKPFAFDRGAVIDRVDDYPIGFPIRREMVLMRKADVPTLLTGP
jgi:hypothetical protein